MLGLHFLPAKTDNTVPEQKRFSCIRQNHWAMNKGQGHGKLHGCIASAARQGICYQTTHELSGLSGLSIKFKSLP